MKSKITETRGILYVSIGKIFSGLSKKSNIVEKNQKKTPVKTSLVIIRCSFDPTLKWDFIYTGFKISAKIIDISFWGSIDKYKFAKGDRLEVEMNILQEWDDSVQVYIHKSYEIITVYSHTSKPEQLSL